MVIIYFKHVVLLGLVVFLIIEDSISTTVGDVFHLGDAIKNCRHLHGRITSVNLDGTYDVEYNDGQWDDNLSFKQLIKSNSIAIYNDGMSIFV